MKERTAASLRESLYRWFNDEAPLVTSSLLSDRKNPLYPPFSKGEFAEVKRKIRKSALQEKSDFPSPSLKKRG